MTGPETAAQPGAEAPDEWATGPHNPEPTSEHPALVDERDLPACAAVSDITGAAAAAVEDAVHRAVRRRVDALAERAVAAAFESSDLAARLEEQAYDIADVTLADQLTPSEPGADFTEAKSPEGEPAPAEETPELFFGSTDQFVRGFLRHAYRRTIDPRSERLWAADWWRYPEAVSRLEALWRAWEALRLDPATGMSVWWRDHADHHMAILFSSDGPFTAAPGISDVHCRPGEPLPCAVPPAALFPDVRLPAG